MNESVPSENGPATNDDDLAFDFKHAAMAVTQLYKKASSQKRAVFLQGYTQCLREIGHHCSANAVSLEPGSNSAQRQYIALESLLEFLNTRFLQVVQQHNQSGNDSTPTAFTNQQGSSVHSPQDDQKTSASLSDMVSSAFTFDFRPSSVQGDSSSLGAIQNPVTTADLLSTNEHGKRRHSGLASAGFLSDLLLHRDTPNHSTNQGNVKRSRLSSVVESNRRT